jgi:hypothetical protein
MRTTIPIRGRRRKAQRGSEIVEFAALAFFLVPTFLWAFINGMNLIRMNEANQVTRDIGDLYIHGVDYSTYEAQAVAQKLAGGFGLSVGSSFAGNNPANNSNGGNGFVVLAQITYIGAPSCASLPNGVSCTNQNQYVFTQYVSFGNSSLQINGAQVHSAMGTPNIPLTTAAGCTGSVSEACMNTSGIINNYITGANALCTPCAAFFQTQLSDGQVAYVAETFFSSPDLNFTAYPAGGIHSMDFF